MLRFLLDEPAGVPSKSRGHQTIPERGKINEAKNNSRNSDLPKLGFSLAGTGTRITKSILRRAMQPTI
jgi:hypothetical protein